MIKDVGILGVLATLALNPPDFLYDRSAAPDTLEAYVTEAQNPDAKPDPLVTVVTNLCPVIAEAAEGEDNMYAKHMIAACALMQSANPSPAAGDLLAMVE